MLAELAAGGFFLVEFVYHRYFETPPIRPMGSLPDAPKKPHADEGGVIPLI